MNFASLDAATQKTAHNCPHTSISDSSTLFPSCNSDDHLALLVIDNAYCHAVVAMQGAQLLRMRVRDDQDLLWLSPNAIFKAGKAIRGGIPICLPWFGPHAHDPHKPQHGFARTVDWHLHAASALDTGATELTWTLDFDPHSPQSQPNAGLFPHAFHAQIVMTLGATVSLQLSIENNSTQPMPLSWAAHSYLPVHDLAAAKVEGLAQCTYLDNTQTNQRFIQTGELTFDSELDRQYINVPEQQCLIEPQSRITVTGRNCNSAIVWNPGPTRAKHMLDVGTDNHLHFICIERGNTADNSLSLTPKSVHTATMTITGHRTL